jgi:hypothetical protein
MPAFRFVVKPLLTVLCGAQVMMHADLYASMKSVPSSPLLSAPRPASLVLICVWCGVVSPISNGFKKDCIALTSYSAALVDKSTLWSGGEAVFDENFNILAKEMVDNGGKEAKKLVDWLAREKDAVLAAKAKGSKQASTDGYKSINALRVCLPHPVSFVCLALGGCDLLQLNLTQLNSTRSLVQSQTGEDLITKNKDPNVANHPLFIVSGARSAARPLSRL